MKLKISILDLSFPNLTIRGYGSAVEHSIADRKVPGSNPGAPLSTKIFSKHFNIQFTL